MLDALKTYLTAQGFENVYIDFMPDAGTTYAVGLFEWNSPCSQVAGEVTHYVQIQVRRGNYDSAKADCKRILELLDSGTEERLLQLDENTTAVIKVRRSTLLLERGEGYTTFSGEIAVWINGE